MGLSVDQICMEATALPNEEKAEIVERLMADIVAHTDPGALREQLSVAERRLAEAKAGSAELIPGPQALARARGILSRHPGYWRHRLDEDA